MEGTWKKEWRDNISSHCVCESQTMSVSQVTDSLFPLLPPQNLALEIWFREREAHKQSVCTPCLCIRVDSFLTVNTQHERDGVLYVWVESWWKVWKENNRPNVDDDGTHTVPTLFLVYALQRDLSFPKSPVWCVIHVVVSPSSKREAIAKSQTL